MEGVISMILLGSEASAGSSLTPLVTLVVVIGNEGLSLLWAPHPGASRGRAFLQPWKA